MYIWGKGRAAGRVVSTFRLVGSGRVGSKESDPWTTLAHSRHGGQLLGPAIPEFVSYIKRNMPKTNSHYIEAIKLTHLIDD